MPESVRKGFSVGQNFNTYNTYWPDEIVEKALKKILLFMQLHKLSVITAFFQQ